MQYYRFMITVNLPAACMYACSMLYLHVGFAPLQDQRVIEREKKKNTERLASFDYANDSKW